MKTIKKVLSLVIVVFMIFSCVCFTSFAATNTSEVLVLLKVTDVTKSIDFYCEYSDKSDGHSIDELCEKLGFDDIDIKYIKMLNPSFVDAEDGQLKISEENNNILIIKLYDFSVAKAVSILRANPNVETAEINQTMELDSTSFSDVSNNSWYFEAVNYVSSKGIMTGYPNGTFGTHDSITRAMACQIFYAYVGSPSIDWDEIGDNMFYDVSGSKWYSNAIAWAKQNNIVSGVGNNMFEPNSPITKAQFTVIICAFAENQDLLIAPKNKYLSFNDQYAIKSWMKDSIEKLSRADIIFGDTTGCFMPNTAITRAEAATIIHSFLTNTATKQTGLFSKYGINNVSVYASKDEMPVPVPPAPSANRGSVVVTFDLEGSSSLTNVEKYVHIKSEEIDATYPLEQTDSKLTFKTTELNFTGPETITVDVIIKVGTHYDIITFTPTVSVLW